MNKHTQFDTYRSITIICIIFLSSINLAFAQNYPIKDIPSQSMLQHGGWNFKSETDHVFVFNKFDEKSGIYDVLATSVFDEKIDDVIAVISDKEKYIEFMPYTCISKFVKTDKTNKWLYQVLTFPIFLSDRHFIVKSVSTRNQNDGTYFEHRWIMDKEMSLQRKTDDKVIPNHNSGAWRLWSIENGQKTLAEYYVSADPGGWIPTFLVNMTNTIALPDVLNSVRKRISSQYKNPTCP